MYEQIGVFIKDLGFPIFVAAYLLITFRKTLKDNNKVIEKNTEVLKELVILVKNINGKNKKKQATTQNWLEKNKPFKKE